MRTCTKCKEVKEDSFFRPRTKTNKNTGIVYKYTSSHCNECERIERKMNNTAEYRKNYKQSRKQANPVLFHMQERISQWKRKDIQSDITVDFLVDLWESQKGLCHYSGEPMILGGTKDNLWKSASLDKLIPENGYRKGNLVWCTYRINTMKGNMTYDEFILFCGLINKYRQ